MQQIEIHKRNEFFNIINHIDDGETVPCLLQEKPKKQFDRLVSFADKLMQRGERAYIEVKFMSQFAKRPKRLDLVSVDIRNNVTIYKLSNPRKYDTDAFELDRILSECDTNRGADLSIRACLVFDDSVDLHQMSGFISELNLNIKVTSFSSNGIPYK